MINLFLIDDHAFFIKGVSEALKQVDTNIHIVGSSTSCREALKQIKVLDVDVVLLDILMPEMNGIDCCRILKELHPEIKVIGFTGEVDPKVLLDMWRCNVNAILLKSCGLEELISTIQGVMKNKVLFGKDVPNFLVHCDNSTEKVPRLTRKELEVLKLLGTGLSRKEVANKMNSSMYSVEFHCKNIFRKFNSNSINIIIAEAKRARIIM
ncbi:MAG: response regulator transcription factor [Bacteroidales bacterium]|nr:response regulator transcription factor [Bacteroidales bacterium]